MNKKNTSKSVATLAAETLQDKSSSQIAKQLAGSALSQYSTPNQTGPQLEEVASSVLKSRKYSEKTKALAASVLSQSNANR